MKTLVVLSALAAVALAAPAVLEEKTEDFKKPFTNVPVIFKREKKSPQESSHPDNPTLVAPANVPSTSQISEFGVSGRSFGLKKPIIIKKKPVGYHVYRDSDEEPAESGETCGKQVKVKFCDVKSEGKMTSSTIEGHNTEMTEKDVKQSIKLAKEAVENLQRDLKKVESKPRTQASPWKHGNSESDAELHQDIEVAREALEHVHKNFGNLESMSLHATTLKNADILDDAQFTIAKTEEQRLAQWKEAIDTIQKNVEIARNIEDSFKTASAETGLLFTDDTMTDSNKHELNKITEHVRTTTDMVTKDENKVDSQDCNINHAKEKSSQKDITEPALTDDDMASSASTISEKKMVDFHNTGMTRHTTGLSTDTKIEKALKPEKSFENVPEEKNADVETLNSQGLFQKDSVASDSTNSIEEIKERKSESEQKVKLISLPENADSVPESTNTMKAVESEDMLPEQERHAAVDSDEIQSQKLNHNARLEKMETVHKKLPEMKSAEQFDEQFSKLNKKEDKTENKDLHKEKVREVDTTMFAKSADEVHTTAQKELLTNTNEQENTAPKKHFEQHLAEAKMANQENWKQHSEIIAPMNNADSAQLHHHKQFLVHPEMREVDEFKNIHQHQLTDLTHSRWAENKNIHTQMESMKSADGIHSQTMDHVHTVQHPGHQHHHSDPSTKNHHFDTTSGHGQLHSRFPDNFMAQGKSADTDMQSYYMSMRDGSGLRPENNRFRWKPTHESSRNAYGTSAAPAAGSSSSGGAVGLFPNANVGSCGIPLLLSCNPSVVSGSLAKAHPAPYSAPAYRTEEDFNFHTKRDVKKTHENLPSPLHRTPNSNQKTSTVLVAKQ